jgi:hypothetical protein
VPLQIHLPSDRRSFLEPVIVRIMVWRSLIAAS